MEAKEIKELKKKYGRSKKGNFEVIDTMPVPHPYCITQHHVRIAADEFSGMLGEGAIQEAERKGYMCDICKKNKLNLKYVDHKKALLVSCKKELKNQVGVADKELIEYLRKHKDVATKEGYDGFAFKKSF